jgi:hypothetical protein
VVDEGGRGEPARRRARIRPVLGLVLISLTDRRRFGWIE